MLRVISDSRYSVFYGLFLSLGTEYVSVHEPQDQEDVTKSLLEEGFVVLETRREKRLEKLVSEYTQAQAKAKRQRVSPTSNKLTKLETAAQFYFEQTG